MTLSCEATLSRLGMEALRRAIVAGPAKLHVERTRLLIVSAAVVVF